MILLIERLQESRVKKALFTHYWNMKRLYFFLKRQTNSCLNFYLKQKYNLLVKLVINILFFILTYLGHKQRK